MGGLAQTSASNGPVSPVTLTLALATTGTAVPSEDVSSIHAGSQDGPLCGPSQVAHEAAQSEILRFKPADSLDQLSIMPGLLTVIETRRFVGDRRVLVYFRHHACRGRGSWHHTLVFRRVAICVFA